MLLPRRALGALATASLVVFAIGCPVLPSTNAFDPNAPDELRAPATVSGSVRYEDGEVGGDVLIEAITTIEDARAVATINTELGTGAFAIQVPTQARFLRFVPERAGFLDVIVPVELFPGETTVLGQITLPFALSNLTLTGRVERLDGGDVGGVEVQVRRSAPGGDGCTGDAVSTTTAADGSFSASGLRPGSYRVSATGDGLTVGVSGEVTVLRDEEADADEGATVQTPAALVVTLDDASDAVTLSATEPDLPAGLVRLPEVDVELSVPFDWADQMRVSDNPTFASGSTGWVPAESGRRYAFDADPGSIRVYVQLRSSCALSGLYSGSVGYDPDGPEVARVRLGTVELEEAASRVVVLESEVSAPLAVDVGDATGVVVDVQVTRGDGGPSPAPQQLIELGNGLIVLRDQVTIPVDQGRYTVALTLSDPVGNLADIGPVLFDVIRDLEPPTTPLPAVNALTITGSVAHLWLQRRDCYGDDGLSVVGRAYVCEENPPQAGLFEVRGGPAFPDFVPFKNPPFNVPVAADGDTEIEIRAVDAANNVSASIGTVVVTQASTRQAFALPADKQLERTRDGTPLLTASGGSALFLLEGRPESLSNPYRYLVAQAVDEPAVSLDADAFLQRGVRKLSYACNNCFSPYGRRAAALGRGGGGLTWLENGPTNSPNVVTRSFQIWPDGDGRIDVSHAAPFNGTDLDGEPAVTFEACEAQGRARCQATKAWNALEQRPPSRAVMTDERVAYNGISGYQATAADLAQSRDEVTLQGPAFIGGRVSFALNGNIQGFAMEMTVPKGTVLHRRIYANYTTSWDSLPVGFDPFVIAASGTGREEAPGVLGSGFAADAEYLLGFVVTEAVPITVPVVAASAAGDGGVGDEGAMSGGGLVVVALDPSTADTILAADVADALVPASEPAIRVLIKDVDPLASGRAGGLAEMRFDGEPNGLARPLDEIAALGLPSTQRTWPIGLAEPSALPLLEDEATSGVPTQCATLLEIEEDVVLRDLRLRGAGALDDIRVGILKSTTGSPYARFRLVDGSPAAGLPLQNGDGSGVACEFSASGAQTSGVFSGTLPGTLVDDVSFGGPLTGPTIQSGVTPNAFEQIITVTGVEGDSFRIVMQTPAGGPSGDPDLYVRVGAEPSYSDYDCRPYLTGANEVCSVTLGPGETEVFVAIDGFQTVNSWELYVQPMIVLDTRPLLAGQRYTAYDYAASVTGGIGVVGTGPGVGFDNYDDYFDDDFTFGTAITDVDTTATLGLAAPVGMSVYNVSLQVQETVDETLVFTDFEGGNLVRVALLDDAGLASTVRMAFDRVPTDFDNDCSHLASCQAGIVAPPDATELYVQIFADADGGNYEVEVTAADVGCASARLYNSQLLLESGTYLVTYGVGQGNFRLTWPGSQPSVVQGQPSNLTSPVRVLGTPTSISYDGNVEVIVSSYDSDAAICDLALEVDSTLNVSALAVDDATIAVAAERRHVDDELVTELLGAPTSSMDELMPLAPPLASDTTLHEVHLLGDVLYALRSGPDGAGPIELVRLPLSPWPTPPLSPPEIIATLASPGAPERLRRASFHDHQLAVAVQTPTGATVTRYRLPADGEDELALIEAVPLSFVPGALVVDDHDLFLWRGAQTGEGGLLHRDLRRMTSLFTVAGVDVTAFASMDDTIVAAVSATFPTPETELIALQRDDDGGLVAGSLGNGPVVTHLGAVGAQTIATVAALEAGGYELGLTAFTLIDDMEGALSTSATRTVIADAATRLSSAPAPTVNDPLRLQREIVLATAEGLVALLSWEGAGRSLAIYELGETSASWAMTTPVATFAIGGDPSDLRVAAGVALVTYEDGGAHLYADDGGGWSAIASADPVSERFIGVRDGEVLVINNPGDLQGARLPAWMPANWRPASAPLPPPVDGGPAPGTSVEDAAMRLPAEAYSHQFVTSAAPSGLLLYDLSAQPPVLWRVRDGGRTALPMEGPHRPLTTGLEAIGRSGAPVAGFGGVLWVRRANGGNALLTLALD